MSLALYLGYRLSLMDFFFFFLSHLFLLVSWQGQSGDKLPRSWRRAKSPPLKTLPLVRADNLDLAATADSRLALGAR